MCLLDWFLLGDSCKNATTQFCLIILLLPAFTTATPFTVAQQQLALNCLCCYLWRPFHSLNGLPPVFLASNNRVSVRLHLRSSDFYVFHLFFFFSLLLCEALPFVFRVFAFVVGFMPYLCGEFFLSSARLFVGVVVRFVVIAVVAVVGFNGGFQLLF